jgi:hypothetical protein
LPRAEEEGTDVRADFVLQVLWLAAPATLTCIAHMGVVKMGLLPRLDVPLDGGRSLLGAPIFGRNKTWRGVVVVVLGTTILGAVQGGLLGAWAETHGLPCVDYALAPPWAERSAPSLAWGYALVNSALGAAYVLGELPNSFLKRRLQIAPGARPTGPWRTLFFALDQGDSAFAGMAVCAFAFSLRWRDVVPAVLALALLHATVTILLHAARVKREV